MTWAIWTVWPIGYRLYCRHNPVATFALGILSLLEVHAILLIHLVWDGGLCTWGRTRSYATCHTNPHLGFPDVINDKPWENRSSLSAELPMGISASADLWDIKKGFHSWHEDTPPEMQVSKHGKMVNPHSNAILGLHWTILNCFLKSF